MRRSALALALVLSTAAITAGVVGAEPRAGGPQVAIFYYTWYGTPDRDGAWKHWSQRGAMPPAALASAFYPVRGAYSSTDPAVLRAQMREIARAGVDTVIVSWWGPGSPEDARLPLVTAAARAAAYEAVDCIDLAGSHHRTDIAAAAADQQAAAT